MIIVPKCARRMRVSVTLWFLKYCSRSTSWKAITDPKLTSLFSYFAVDICSSAVSSLAALVFPLPFFFLQGCKALPSLWGRALLSVCRAILQFIHLVIILLIFLKALHRKMQSFHMAWVVKWMFSWGHESHALHIVHTNTHSVFQISLQGFVYPWSLRHGRTKFRGIYIQHRSISGPYST